MECVCYLDADYDDASTFSKVKKVTARTPHVCCECGEAIEPGAAYESASGVYDGSWWKAKTCLLCARIRSAYCCSWVYGELRETLSEALGFDYTTKEE